MADHYRNSKTKRFLDVAIASVAIIATAILIPIVFSMNLVFSRGPLFFSQTRIGKNGEEFSIIKFRTMELLTAPTSRDQSNEVRQQSITSIGYILRQTHLDEFPQSINVLNNQMSIVGPRPYMKSEYDELKHIEGFAKRNFILPGITGLAQISYEHENTELSAIRKLAYDLEYLHNCSFRMDLSIIIKTILEAFKRRGV